MSEPMEGPARVSDGPSGPPERPGSGSTPEPWTCAHRLAAASLTVAVAALLFGTGVLGGVRAPGEDLRDPAPAGPGSRAVTVLNTVTSGGAMAGDRPAYLSTRPQNYCADAGCVAGSARYSTGDVIEGVACRTAGPRATNGNDGDAGDDRNPGLVSSELWYGVALPDGSLGYISEVWLAPQSRGGLGLPACPR